MASPFRFRGSLRALVISGFFAALFAMQSASQSAQPAQNQARVPVLVELFTSEGCSDCPPADRILEELDRKQPIPGAQAIVLSEHVTYWNHLGWRDPFSLEEVDQRQKDYGDRFNLDSIYTPQAVIDGSVQLVGNNGAGMAKAIGHAAAATGKRPLEIADARLEKNAVTFTVRGAADPSLRVFAVVAADANPHQVQRGENAGRTLHHVAVAHSFKEFSASALDGRILRVPATEFPGEPGKAPLRVVVFLAEKKTGRVVAATEQTLSR